MKRLVIDLPLSTLEAMGFGPPRQTQVELLTSYILKSDRRTMTQVSRVRILDPAMTVEELFSNPLVVSGRLLRKEMDVWVLLVTLKTTRPMRQLLQPFPDVFLDHPMENRKGKLRVTLVGEEASLRRLMEVARAVKYHFDVVRLENLDAGPANPTAALTSKQQRVLRTAYEMGYFESPKRVRLEELARLFGEDRSNVMAVLRRAQKNLLKAVLQ
ncbi:MAG: helix-turn-helix domain-containing protein [Halobacteria archaeon]